MALRPVCFFGFRPRQKNGVVEFRAEQSPKSLVRPRNMVGFGTLEPGMLWYQEPHRRLQLGLMEVRSAELDLAIEGDHTGRSTGRVIIWSRKLRTGAALCARYCSRSLMLVIDKQTPRSEEAFVSWLKCARACGILSFQSKIVLGRSRTILTSWRGRSRAK